MQEKVSLIALYQLQASCWQQLLPQCFISVFVVEPGPRQVVAPVGSLVELNCSVREGFRLARWNIFIPGSRELSSSDSTDIIQLNSKNIFVRSYGESSSELIINSTTVLRTYVDCEARNSTTLISGLRSHQVNISIYGMRIIAGQVELQVYLFPLFMVRMYVTCIATARTSQLLIGTSINYTT